MDFDPTYNYSKTDLTIDSNLVCWKFAELIKSLVTLSESAGRQVEIIGIGATCDEMALDFDNYFTLEFETYFNNGLLTVGQISMLKDLDAYLDERSGDKSPDFWDDFLLETNPEWEVVRLKARSILADIGMQDLTLVFDREEQYEMTDKEKKITMQLTKTRLVRQLPS